MRKNRLWATLIACSLIAIVLTQVIAMPAPAKAMFPPTMSDRWAFDGLTYANGTEHRAGGIDGQFYVYNQNVGSSTFMVEFLCLIYDPLGNYINPGDGGYWSYMLTAGYYQYGSGKAYAFYGFSNGYPGVSRHTVGEITKSVWHQVTIRNWGGGQWGIFIDGAEVYEMTVGSGCPESRCDNAILEVFVSKKYYAGGTANAYVRGLKYWNASMGSWYIWDYPLVGYTTGLYAYCPVTNYFRVYKA